MVLTLASYRVVRRRVVITLQTMSDRRGLEPEMLRFCVRPDNNVLIRSGEAPLVGWSRLMLYSGFSILLRSVVRSANFNGRSDNTDVIHLPMTKFSLKSLLVAVAMFCGLVAVTVWAFDAYKQHSFKRKIEPVWSEAPVSSTPAQIKEINDIVIYFDGDDLSLKNSPTAELQKCEAGDYSYDLVCSMGKFRVTTQGNAFTDLTSKISSEQRSFDLIRDSLMLDNTSRASTAPLWLLRTQYMPIGCNTRLQHFETPTKMGFISGTLATRPGTIVLLFDSSGEYSISILPIEPTVETWDSLAGAIALEKFPATGG